MKKRNYMPQTQLGYLAWQDNLVTAATGLAGPLGLTGEIAALTARNTGLHAKYNTLQAAQNAAKAAVTDYNTAEAASRLADRVLVQRAKLSPNYTDALGNNLGVIGAEDTTDLTTAKPTLTATDHLAGNIEVQFNKSISQGVDVYAKRDGDADFVFLARDTQSPYLDNRPLLQAGKPELRRYKAIYVLNDAQVGSFSDEIVVNCQP
ncbi:MAG: hypothetical protein RLZZ350_1435 [Verrucomicrobiota bacterium]|jgi:hypothetical protein